MSNEENQSAITQQEIHRLSFDEVDVKRLRDAAETLRGIHSQVGNIGALADGFLGFYWEDTVNAEGARMTASKANFLCTLTLDLARDLEKEANCLEEWLAEVNHAGDGTRAL
jgi:hypothetical protein